MSPHFPENRRLAYQQINVYAGSPFRNISSPYELGAEKNLSNCVKSKRDTMRYQSFILFGYIFLEKWTKSNSGLQLAIGVVGMSVY